MRLFAALPRLLRKITIRTRLVALFFVLTVVPLLVTTSVAAIAGLRGGQHQVIEQLQSVATLKEDGIKTWLSESQALLASGLAPDEQAAIVAFVGANPGVATRSSPPPDLREHLKHLVQISQFEEISALNREGLVVLSSDPTREGKLFAQERYFQEGFKAPAIQPPLYSPALGRTSIVISLPLLDWEEMTVGVLAGRIGMQELSRIMLQRTGLGATGKTYLIGANHALLTGLLSTETSDQLYIRTEGATQVLSERRNGAGLYPNAQGVLVVGVYHWLPELKIALIAEQAQAEAFGATYSTLQTNIIVAVLTALLAIGVGFVVTDSIAHPLADLADRIRAGDLSVRVEVVSNDEIGTLAMTFNAMADQLQQTLAGLEQRVADRTAELAQRADQLSLINRVGRDVSSLLDLETILPQVASLIRDRFDYYAVFIVLAEPDHDAFKLGAAATSEAGDPLDGNRFDGIWPESVVGEVARKGESLVINDLAADPRYAPAHRLPRARSELALPLNRGDMVLGVLDLQSDRPEAFRPEQVQVLQTLADQLATAINNARLFQVAQAARADAEAANRAKSAFLANMSHELRTPLNSIINFNGFIADGVFGPVTSEQREFLLRALHSAEHLLGLINDILDLSKIEAGKMELSCERSDLAPILTDVMTTAQGLNKKGLSLQLALQADLPSVWADPVRVRQILLNLLSNAIKFTERGQVTLRGWADEQWVTISVQDTGIGISAEDLPKVFADFVQVDSSLTRRAGGTGLGIPISKRFVEMHGGKMWVESQPGIGSTFFFTLPRLAPLQGVGETLLEPTSTRVLVIDKDPATRETIAHHLAKEYQVSFLTEPHQALEVVRQRRPDVVVLDLLLPSDGGWDVLQALKADPETRDIPVVGCGVLREQQMVLALGAGGYLLKPLEGDELRQMVAQFAPQGGTILAVDDDPDALTVVTQMLSRSNYQVITAPDGLAGLAALRSHHPDLLILDLMMPELSGFAVLAELRADPHTAHLPVIVVTAKDLTTEERALLQHQAARLLQKGQFNTEEFIQTIRRALGQQPNRGTEI